MMTLDSKWTSNTSQRLLYISRVPLTRTFDSIGKMPWRCLVMLSSALLRNERERALLLPNSPRVSRGQGWAQKSWRSAVCQLFISKYRRHPRVLSAPWSTSASSINLTSFCMCLFVWKDVVGPKKRNSRGEYKFIERRSGRLFWPLRLFPEKPYFGPWSVHFGCQVRTASTSWLLPSEVTINFQPGKCAISLPIHPVYPSRPTPPPFLMLIA